MRLIKQERPVLCFIDEVLRGTNTVERMQASSEILKNLNTGRALCFWATHDIELTTILKDCYSNYHFQEEVTEDEVKFDYSCMPDLQQQGMQSSFLML